MKERTCTEKRFVALIVILILSTAAALYADDVKDNVEVVGVKERTESGRYTMYAEIQNYNQYNVEVQISFSMARIAQTKKTIVVAGATKRLELASVPGGEAPAGKKAERARVLASFNAIPRTLQIVYVKPL